MFSCIEKNCGHNNYQNECRFYSLPSLPKDAATFEKWEKSKYTLQEMQQSKSERLTVCSCHLPYYDKENVGNIRPSKRSNFDDSIVAKKSKKETVLKTLVHNEINRESLSLGNCNIHAKRIGIDVTKQERIPTDLVHLEEETKRLKHQNEVYRKNIEIETKRSIDMAVKGERLSRNLVRLEDKTKRLNEQKEIYRNKFELETRNL